MSQMRHSMNKKSMTIDIYPLCIIYNYNRDLCMFTQPYHGQGYQARVWYRRKSKVAYYTVTLSI